MRLTTFVFCCIFWCSLSSQKNYPKDAFRSPVDIPIILAGSFGELRSNHFHSGIDIKTQQRQGLPIYAIGNGTVTRIKISLGGFGKALYVAHPNGYTSVYAHLKKFSPKLEAYIKELQYKKQSYEVEAFPDFGMFEVKKGEVIAYSGNTGSSFGPHLHFEIRNSVSSKPINPLLYGYSVRDATDPTILRLFGYPLSDGAHINQSAKKIQLNFTKQADGSFKADTVSALGTIGFGFVGFDRQDMAANKNGIYSVKQRVNGKLYSEFDFESFSFAETRYINTFIDYEYFGRFKQRIQKCFKEAYNKLSIYKKLHFDGKISVEEGLAYTVELLLSDLAGNQIKVVIPVKGESKPIKIKEIIEKTPYYVETSKPSSFDLGSAKVYFPANTFYKNLYLKLEEGKDTVRVHDRTVAAHRNFTLVFDVTRFTKQERQKLFIARLDERGRVASYTETYKKEKTFTARTRNFGAYTLIKDTLAPKVRARNFNQGDWLNKYRYLSLEIDDDLSGIATYNGYLDDRWILMEYEPKQKRLTYTFENDVAKGIKHDLKVVVTDNVGNTTTFETNFFRK